MNLCYIGLGANLNNPREQIEIALQALSNLEKTQLVAVSSLYASQPLGPQDQPDFYNAVAKITTELTPLELLDALQTQEQQQGRVKLRHWGERCIDLDILLYGNVQMSSPRLTLPHLELQKRSFVVTPLLELEPNLILPCTTALSEVRPEFTGELLKLGSLKKHLT